MNAIILPTSEMSFALTAAIHTTAMLTPNITIVIAGLRTAITLYANSDVLVRSLLASSKRFSSCAWVLNARMTISPASSSCATWLTRSILVCICLNLGSTVAIITIIATKSTATATATTMTSPDIPRLNRTALMMPPMPMTGANITRRKNMMEKIWICVMSLVPRVINEDCENLSNSALEKLPTLANTS